MPKFVGSAIETPSIPSNAPAPSHEIIKSCCPVVFVFRFWLKLLIRPEGVLDQNRTIRSGTSMLKRRFEPQINAFNGFPTLFVSMNINATPPVGESNEARISFPGWNSDSEFVPDES